MSIHVSLLESTDLLAPAALDCNMGRNDWNFSLGFVMNFDRLGRLAFSNDSVPECL